MTVLRTRPALAADVFSLWPAVKAAHLMATPEEFSDFREAGPWRVRVTDGGEALLLALWRTHLDVLAIRGLWGASQHVADLVDDAAAVARAQGLGRVLSPLVVRSAAGPYLAAGMEEAESIVALQARCDALAPAPAPAGIRLRPGVPTDIPQLAALDARCFDEFWRYGERELAESIRRERVSVAEHDDGRIAGYATCAIWGATATVGRLAVADHARRRGVGRSLLADEAGWALRGGAHTLTLCTQEDNAGSRALYAATGFVELPERFILATRGV